MIRWLLIVGILFAAPVPARAAEPVFQILTAPGDAHWANHALSNHGDVIAVNAAGHYYLWTRSSGYRDLGSGHLLVSTVGISGDGRVVYSTLPGFNGSENVTCAAAAANDEFTVTTSHTKANFSTCVFTSNASPNLNCS